MRRVKDLVRMDFRRKVEITEIARITRSGPLELKQSDSLILICQ